MFTFIDIKHLMNKLKNAKICEKAPLSLTLVITVSNKNNEKKNNKDLTDL